MAAGDFQFRLNGADQLLRRLKTLPDKLQQKIGRKSARKAMAIVRTAARENAKRIDDPETAERIHKNVYLQQSRRGSKRIGGVLMKVGILGGARTPMGRDVNAEAQPGGDTRHWRFVELGQENAPPQPFLRPALEQNAGRVVETLIAGINSDLDEVVRE